MKLLKEIVRVTAEEKDDLETDEDWFINSEGNDYEEFEDNFTMKTFNHFIYRQTEFLPCFFI